MSRRTLKKATKEQKDKDIILVNSIKSIENVEIVQKEEMLKVQLNDDVLMEIKRLYH